MISRNQRWGDTIYLVEVIGGCKKLMVVPLPWANQGKTGQDRALLGFPGSFIRFPRLSSSRSKSVCQFTGILEQGRCGGFYARFPNPLAMSSISSFILWCPRFYSILWFILSSHICYLVIGTQECAGERKKQTRFIWMFDWIHRCWTLSPSQGYQLENEGPWFHDSMH